MATKEELQKEQAELKAELDELKTRLAEADAKYRTYDQKLQQEGLSEALEAKYEKERAAAERQQTELRQRRDPLLARLTEIEKLVASPPVAPAAASRALKVLVKAEVFSTTIVEFFAKELEERATKRLRQDSTTIREGALIEFSSALFNEKGLPHVVYIRECYRTEADKVHDWMGTKKPREQTYSVFVGGARGVGKSVLGTLMVFEFVDLGYAVLYEHKQQRMLLFGSNLIEDQKKELLRLLKLKQYDSALLSDPGVYKFSDPEDRGLYNELVMSDKLIHVLDMGDGAIDQNLPTTGVTRRLILSSPREASLKNLPKLNCQYIIMPLWTMEELQMARSKCYPHLTEDTVHSQFAKYGGIARHVLQYSEEKSSSEFTSQLESLNSNSLREILALQKYEDLPHLKNMGFLIHVVPHPKDPSRCLCTFASHYAFRAIVNKFQKQREFQVKEFASMLKHNPEAASLYGSFLEETAHFVLTQEATYTIHELGSERINQAQGPRGWTVQWPEMEDSVSFDHISSITGDIKVNVYFRPNKKNYPTIDAFVLMDGHILDPTKFPTRGTIVLVLIQVTVSNSHWVNGSNIKRLHEQVYDRWEGRTEAKFNIALPVVLVFATRKYPKGVHTYQTPLKDDKTRFSAARVPKFPQYSLVLEKEFETIWEDAEKYFPQSSE